MTARASAAGFTVLSQVCYHRLGTADDFSLAVQLQATGLPANFEGEFYAWNREGFGLGGTTTTDEAGQFTTGYEDPHAGSSGTIGDEVTATFYQAEPYTLLASTTYTHACDRWTLPPDVTKEWCKAGEWRPYPEFKSQGDCVAFVETEGKNKPGTDRPAVGVQSVGPGAGFP